jgi:antitoxin PrlF
MKTGKRITQRRRVNRDSQRRGESQKKEFYAEGHRDTEDAEKRECKEECDKVRNGSKAMKRQAKLTSKGQITVPRDIRRRLGVRAGDKLEFEDTGEVVQVKAVRDGSVFEKYAGIGNPGIGSGRKAIQKWIREIRGHEDDE